MSTKWPKVFTAFLTLYMKRSNDINLCLALKDLLDSPYGKTPKFSKICE